MTDSLGVSGMNKSKTLTQHLGEQPNEQRWRENPESFKRRKTLWDSNPVRSRSRPLRENIFQLHTQTTYIKDTDVSEKNIFCKTTVKLRIYLSQMKKKSKKNRKEVQEIQGKMETKPRGE